MNFAKSKNPKLRPNIKKIMKEGDLVVIYERHDSLNHIYLAHSKIHNMKFGSFYHDDIIGKPFGSKIHSRTSTGWLYVLEPTPELWGLAVNTRTQIVNELDSSVCVMNMELRPGCRVVESGTGSGCMTLSLARAVAPHGHVFTFEYNAVRAQAAIEEMKKFDVEELVTVQHRDVCGKYRPQELGFGPLPPQSMDAVFLDLPEPWLALDHALLLLKPGCVLCSYSPCIGQVLRTCERLRSLGFLCIRMIEARLRPHDARYVEMERMNLGEEGGEQSRDSEKEKKGKERDSEKERGKEGEESRKRSRKGEEKNRADVTKEKEIVREGEGEEETEGGEEGGEEGEGMAEGSSPSFSPRNPRGQGNPSLSHFFLPSSRTLVARPATTMKGHTAFLTFALSPPSLPTDLLASLLQAYPSSSSSSSSHSSSSLSTSCIESSSDSPSSSSSADRSNS